MMRDMSLHPPCDPDAVSPQLLIGTQFALYREVLAGVFAALRPAVSVRVIPDTALDASVRRTRPLLVICSEVTSAVEDGACAWIRLNPDTSQDTIVSVHGEQRVIPHPTISELVNLVDDVWESAPVSAAG